MPVVDIDGLHAEGCITKSEVLEADVLHHGHLRHLQGLLKSLLHHFLCAGMETQGWGVRKKG